MSKKYILIQNDGEIETNSFELIGASTKRGETGKIGFFGSGLKYSIAYMMRNNIDFKVFSGEQELIFTTMPESLKDQTFDRICINGKPTSYTVTMGPTWKEDWFVLREVYCNALDEGACQLVRDTENINPCEGKTRIYIELTERLKSVVDNWDAYFSSDREPLFVASQIYTCYLAQNEKGGYHSNQDIQVYPKTVGALYRKGIRVYSNEKAIYDYGVIEADINEDRTASQASAMGYAFSSMMSAFVNEEWVKNILRTGLDDIPCREYQDMSNINSANNSPSNQWVNFSQDYMLVIKEISGKYSQEMIESPKEIFLIPSVFARHIKKHCPEINILGMGKAIGDTGMTDVTKTPKMEYLLKETLSAMKEMNYECYYPITVVQFDNEDVLGAADLKQKHIYLSTQVFDMGRRKIALTIMEENEHILSQANDETRAFQNHIFSQWLKTMENQNGLFL